MTSVNHVFVELNQAFIDKVKTPGGLELYLDPSYNPEWNCAVTGKVASLPLNQTEVTKKLKIGDDVAFSYIVVLDRDWGSDRGHFILFDGNEYNRFYRNPNGEKIRVMAYQGPVSLKWVGVYNDKNGELIDGIQGTESEVERWLSQFKFGGVQNAKFNNLIEINGKEYWKVLPEDLLAKKEKNGITMLSDRLLCKPYEIDVTERLRLVSNIHIPASSVKERHYDKAIVIGGGGDLKLLAGDIVATREQFVEKYNLWGTDYFLIQKRNVTGIWN